ncbi:MAG: succinate dehydrogenase, cytochrome b556 subunit [Gammaproteobacteria bacterium]
MNSPADRPLSPHLQVYRWTLTMTLSILHRVTGVTLSAGLLLLVSWLLAAADGPERYAEMQGFLDGPIGMTLLIGWTFALALHFANGIRHLFWDMLIGLDMPQARASGWAVWAFAIILTAALWGLA